MNTSLTPFQPSTPMQYLAYFLERAMEQLKTDPSKALKNIQRAHTLAKDLDPYLENHLSPLNNDHLNLLLIQLIEKTNNTPWQTLYEEGKTQKKLNPVMLTGSYEGRLLRLFAQLIKARRILEIGMFTGYSTLMLASALPENGSLVTCEEEPFLVTFVQPFFSASRYSHQIDIRCGQALEILKTLAHQKQRFDLIFLDANKTEYIDYYSTIRENNLLAPEGIICADNTLMKGLVYASRAKKTIPSKSIKQFNQLLAQDPTLQQMILPVRDGLSIIRLKNS